MTEHDKIFRAIERITGKHIVCFRDGITKYVFKVWSTGEWLTINREFVNDFAGI